MSDMSVGNESGDAVSLTKRIGTLQDEHSQLEQALAEEEARPLPDSLTIKLLKQKKLAIKDELAALTGD